MRRRDFLYNTGLLIPALLASPARVLASQRTINTEVLIIHPETGLLQAVATAIDKLPVQNHEIRIEDISHFEYLQQGFLITTSDNTLLQASRIILHSGCRVHATRALVEISMGSKTFHLNIASTNNEHKPAPEYWCLTTQQLLAHKTNHFMNRQRPVLLCLSGA